MNYELITKKKNGFAILYSVLIASILLAIGLAILNITIKELLFSSLGRESQFAFYAADTGAECALYWDIKNDAFSISSPPYDNINCIDKIISVTGSPNEKTFKINFAPKQPYCATVTVKKIESPAETIIEARGYNNCDSANSRRVERAIKIEYDKI
jgi:hypothetical protein